MKNRAVSIAMDIARRAERALGGRMGYAEGGEVSNRNMSKAISERAMRGLEPTPEQKQYLENMQALRDKRGDENLDAILSLGKRDIPMPNAGMARKVSNRAMSGRDDFSGPEQQHLERSAPGKEERSVAPGVLGGIGAELTGAPSMIRGAGNIGRGISEGDPYRIGGGALEATIGAAPGVGKLGLPGLRAVTEGLTGSIPRFAGTSAAAGFLNSFSDDAAAAGRNKADFVQNHAAVKTLIEKRREAQMAMQKAEEDIILNNPAVRALQEQKRAVEQQLARTNAQHARSGPETQKQALAPFQSEIARINGAIEDVSKRARAPFEAEIGRINAAITAAETDAAEEFKGQATFRENYPGAPMAMMGAGLGLAAGLPFAKGMMERGADRFARRPGIEDATKSAREAFASGASDADTAIAQTLLRNKLGAWDRAHHPIETGAKYIGAAGSGAMTGAEFSQLPEQLDYISHEPGHRAREIAVQQFANPDYWKERIGPAALGGIAGVTGLKLSKLAPTNKEFLTEAREIANRGKEPTFLDRAMSRVTTGKAAKGPTEDALADVRRYREAAGPASPGKSADETAASIRNTPPASAAPSQPPTVAPSTTGANLPGANLSPDLPIGPAQGPSPSPGLGFSGMSSQPALPSPFQNFKPSEGIVPTGSTKSNDTGIESLIKGLEYKDVKPGATGKTKHGEGGKFDSPKAQFDRMKKKLLDEVQARNEGFNRGGVVGRAMRIAKNAGGRVHVGPTTHRADGGRTDTIPVDLPASSYVVPSDVVSSLGEGDTNAGYNVLANMFGSHETEARDGARPAIIAGGEYVLSPEQVAQIGGGNVEMGFQALDQWIKLQRRKTIQTLKNLPPPAKD